MTVDIPILDFEKITRVPGIKITLFNIVNRRLRPGTRIVGDIREADAQCENADGVDKDNLSWVFGHYTDWDKLWVNWKGDVALRDGTEPAYEPVEPEIIVDPEHVRAYCGSVIDRFYKPWQQMNIIREGGDALTEMTEWIDGMRAASNAIEKLKPIPVEFHLSPLWPEHGVK